MKTTRVSTEIRNRKQITCFCMIKTIMETFFCRVLQWIFSLIDLWSVVELEAVVMLAAPLFPCLNQQETPLVKSKTLTVVCVMFEQRSWSYLFVSQDELPERRLRVHTLFLICCCCNTEIEVTAALDGSWRMQNRRKCGSMQLVHSHDLRVWTEDTWVVNDRHCFDELCVHPADVRVHTPAFTWSAGWLSCGERR